MDLKTQEAVEESVRHWSRILRRVYGEEPTAKQCSLCKKYDKIDALNNDEVISCIDELYNPCPIKERTGLSGCEGTPWSGANIAYLTMRHQKKGSWTDKQEKAIRRELGWVKSFLPTIRPIPYV